MIGDIQDVANMTGEQMSSLLLGDQDSTVRLRIVRNDTDGPLEYAIKRGPAGTIYKSPHVGKIIKVENCWFDASRDLTRDKKEGDYVIRLRQGGAQSLDSRIVTSNFSLFSYDHTMPFYAESAKARGLKRIQDIKNENSRELVFKDETKYHLYFEVIDRPFKDPNSPLTFPCAKLVHEEIVRTVLFRQP